METETRNHSVSIPTLARIGWVVAAAAAGLILTLTIIIAVVVAQTSNFDSSYKTGPRFAETGEVITYTIVAVNAGGPVTNVLLSDPVPNGAVFVPGSCVYRRQTGGPLICNPPPDL